MGMQFSLPLNMRFFQKNSIKPVILPGAAKKSDFKPSSQKPDLAMMMDDDEVMALFPRRVRAGKSEETLPRLTDGAVGTHISGIMNGIAETLAKSCLYFSPDNLMVLGGRTDVFEMLERMDPLLRATLMDGKMRPEQQMNFRAFVESAGDLKAGAEAARLAAQIFLLLHDSKTPSSGLAPLKKVTDSALRTLRTSAAAISTGNVVTARMALKALAETEEMGRELTAMIPTLAAYRSPTICRMILAALHALLVSANSVAQVASNLVIPPQETVEQFLSAL